MIVHMTVDNIKITKNEIIANKFNEYLVPLVKI